jgi:hypothetical protein
MMGQPQPHIHHKVITVMAGDHGGYAEWVSAHRRKLLRRWSKTSCTAAQQSTCLPAISAPGWLS